jgi:hypothetical protein
VYVPTVREDKRYTRSTTRIATYGERDGLHPEMRENGWHYLSSASYTLSKEEKVSMFECLSSIKVPSGYSSNIKGEG